WLWQTNEKSADYSFNKSHAACYALISYRTAWLKANYPAEYMAALISSVMDTKDKVPFFVAQTEQMGIEILPPDVNESDHEFMVVEGRIRFGLDAVKGVGFSAVEAMKRAREDGPFASIWDFCERVDGRTVNKKASEAFEQAELLAVEKESIGLFVSAHPLKAVREAMRLRVDCPLAQLSGRRDGEWVTVGGIITQGKKIRTKRGDHMMFATLDDLEG